MKTKGNIRREWFKLAELSWPYEFGKVFSIPHERGILKESNLIYEWSLEGVCLSDYFWFSSKLQKIYVW